MIEGIKERHRTIAKETDRSEGKTNRDHIALMKVTTLITSGGKFFHKRQDISKDGGVLVEDGKIIRVA